MPFSHRAFCTVSESPSLSEVLVWLRQNGHHAKISGGSSADDLLSCYWEDVQLIEGEGDSALNLRCLRRDTPGSSTRRAFAETVADFVTDVDELPQSAARERVLAQMANARTVLVVEFPADGVFRAAETLAECITALFVERAQGLAQRDGVGFVDEDDDLILALG